MKLDKNKILKIVFIILAISLAIPSIIYLIQNKTVVNFGIYYNFFINNGEFKTLSTTLYLLIFTSMIAIYIYFIKEKVFTGIKQILIYTGIIGIIFIIMLPWTSADIFYYMGVGELNSVYGQNPYYVTMQDYYNQNEEEIDDEILEKGVGNFWSNTTVVYGPVAQFIFSAITKISFKSVNIALILFKMLNLIVHLVNCYIIYKLTKKTKFVIMYGLNPFIFIEYIGNVHNDIILVMFILLAIYFLIKKKKLLPSVFFLALATGIKYFTVLLLPIFILYYFRNEKSILKRILRCIEYGLIFAIIIALEYASYIRDFSIFDAIFTQNTKLCRSIYSAINLVLSNYNIDDLETIMEALSKSVLCVLVIIYFKIFIDILTAKNIKFSKIMRKYNLCLWIFLLCLTTFQPWYIIWMIATCFWQKPQQIRNIIGLSLIVEYANSVYMFLRESYLYDLRFVIMNIIAFVMLQIFTNKKLTRKYITIKEKISKRREEKA